MTPNDKPRFGRLMAGIAAVYHVKLTEDELEVVWNALKLYPFATICEAVTRHVRNPDCGQFMPKPADIVRTLEGGYTFRALQAWSKVRDALRKIGTRVTVVFDDPLIHLVIMDMGGWISLGHATQHELTFLESNFEKRYCGYLARKIVCFPKQLTGVDENNDRKNDRPVKNPKLVGNGERALAVYRQGVESHQLSQFQIMSLECALARYPDTNTPIFSISHQEHFHSMSNGEKDEES